MPIKAILFDLDDTLIRSTEAYKTALRASGIDPHSISYQSARARVKARLGKNHPSSHNRLLYFKEMNGQFPLQRMARYEKALLKAVRSDWKTNRCAALLKKLSKKFHLALVSNENTRTQLIKLQAIDPKGNLFKTVVTSEEVGVEKPHPKIFREVFRRLGKKPSECLMVGDDLRADIAPMKKLGGRAILVKDCNLRPILEDLLESR